MHGETPAGLRFLLTQLRPADVLELYKVQARLPAGAAEALMERRDLAVAQALLVNIQQNLLVQQAKTRPMQGLPCPLII